MDRLTKTYADGSHGVADDLPCGENSYDFKKLLVERVGKYEDTGLTPEQIRQIDKVFLEQAKELMEFKNAEEQGTLISVPVAKGNIIWEIINDGVDRAYIQGIEVQEVSDSRIWANDACFDYDDIGRTIFLLPKEAEKALAEMEDAAHDR